MTEFINKKYTIEPNTFNIKKVMKSALEHKVKIANEKGFGITSNLSDDEKINQLFLKEIERNQRDFKGLFWGWENFEKAILENDVEKQNEYFTLYVKDLKQYYEFCDLDKFVF